METLLVETSYALEDRSSIVKSRAYAEWIQVVVNAARVQIHSTVHKARPDIHAACHAHGISGRAWSTFGKPLGMLVQDSYVFYNSHSVYKNFGGVVFEGAEAERLAKSLDENRRAAILQNYGLVTTGGTVDEVEFLFQSMERLCEIQLEVEAESAAGVMEKVFLTDEAAKYTCEMARIR